MTELNNQPFNQNSNGIGWAHSNVWIGGKMVASYDYYGPSLHFNLEDPLGTKRVVANILGEPDEMCTSLPFGNDLNNPWSVSCQMESNSLDTFSDPSEHHFTQKERDVESGNDYFEARYYSSAMGRFMSPDWSAKETPVPYAVFTDPQSLNLYAYVRNNPLMSLDPDGHAGCDTLRCDQNTAFDKEHGTNWEATSEANEKAKAQQQAAGGGQQGSGSSSSGKLRIPLIAVPLDLTKDGAHIIPTQTLNSERGRSVDYGLFELNKDGTLGWRNRNFTIGLVESYVYGHADDICNHSNCSDSSGTLHDVQRVNDAKNDGNAFAVKRQWTANGVSIPVWNPTSQKPAQFEILHLQFQSDFTMEYK